MSPEEINNVINEYVRDNLSPKPEQRDYISSKYEELRGFLGKSCFQAGSYARYTAIDPVHDLDVIYPVQDHTIQNDPSKLVSQLRADLAEQYKNSKTQVKEITAQTHSVTIVFSDFPGGDFSIDVVPAIEQDEQNTYGQPLYMVPEILRLNRQKREDRYGTASTDPIGWIKSDPRGYIKAASDLNKKNSDFRHTTKLMKGWRHQCKEAYGDDYKLKSFHLEQIVGLYFESNPNSNTLKAVIDCLSSLPEYLARPQIRDRADSSRKIDEYVAELSPPEHDLILKLQSQALAITNQLQQCQNPREVIQKIKQLLSINKPRPSSPPPRNITPQQPWSC